MSTILNLPCIVEGKSEESENRCDTIPEDFDISEDTSDELASACGKLVPS